MYFVKPEIESCIDENGGKINKVRVAFSKKKNKLYTKTGKPSLLSIPAEFLLNFLPSMIKFIWNSELPNVSIQEGDEIAEEWKSPRRRPGGCTQQPQENGYQVSTRKSRVATH